MTIEEPTGAGLAVGRIVRRTPGAVGAAQGGRLTRFGRVEMQKQARLALLGVWEEVLGGVGRAPSTWFVRPARATWRPTRVLKGKGDAAMIFWVRPVLWRVWER